MLKKLHRKILLINMALVSVVLLAALLLFGYHQSQTRDEDLYRELRQAVRFAYSPERPNITIGRPRPEGAPSAPPPSTACVVVRHTPDGDFEILEENRVSIAEDTLQHAVETIVQAQETSGKLFRHRLGYYREFHEDACYIALSDLTTIFYDTVGMFAAGTGLFLAGELVLFFVSLALSSMAVKPVALAWQQQKRFVADASHELKTPLTVILANLNILSAHKDESVAQQAKWLNSTLEEAEEMKQLIDQMLLLAKTDAAEALRISHVNCSELVTEQLLCLEPVAYERNVKLCCHVTPELYLQTDPHLLQHLVRLLVENAIKYTPTGSDIDVTLQNSRGILLSVRSWGSPIPKEDLPHLFERFYRSDKARSSEGAGLGLAIAHSIVEQLHGKLWVVSNETQGTTFFAEFRKGSKA